MRLRLGAVLSAGTVSVALGANPLVLPQWLRYTAPATSPPPPLALRNNTSPLATASKWVQQSLRGRASRLPSNSKAFKDGDETTAAPKGPPVQNAGKEVLATLPPPSAPLTRPPWARRAAPRRLPTIISSNKPKTQEVERSTAAKSPPKVSAMPTPLKLQPTLAPTLSPAADVVLWPKLKCAPAALFRSCTELCERSTKNSKEVYSGYKFTGTHVDFAGSRRLVNCIDQCRAEYLDARHPPPGCLTPRGTVVPGGVDDPYDVEKYPAWHRPGTAAHYVAHRLANDVVQVVLLPVLVASLAGGAALMLYKTVLPRSPVGRIITGLATDVFNRAVAAAQALSNAVSRQSSSASLRQPLITQATSHAETLQQQEAESKMSGGSMATPSAGGAGAGGSFLPPITVRPMHSSPGGGELAFPPPARQQPMDDRLKQIIEEELRATGQVFATGAASSTGFEPEGAAGSCAASFPRAAAVPVIAESSAEFKVDDDNGGDPLSRPPETAEILRNSSESAGSQLFDAARAPSVEGGAPDDRGGALTSGGGAASGASSGASVASPLLWSPSGRNERSNDSEAPFVKDL